MLQDYEICIWPPMTISALVTTSIRFQDRFRYIAPTENQVVECHSRHILVINVFHTIDCRKHLKAFCLNCRVAVNDCNGSDRCQISRKKRFQIIPNTLFQQLFWLLVTLPPNVTYPFKTLVSVYSAWIWSLFVT